MNSSLIFVKFRPSLSNFVPPCQILSASIFVKFCPTLSNIIRFCLHQFSSNCQILRFYPCQSLSNLSIFVELCQILSLWFFVKFCATLSSFVRFVLVNFFQFLSNFVQLCQILSWSNFVFVELCREFFQTVSDFVFFNFCQILSLTNFVKFFGLLVPTLKNFFFAGKSVNSKIVDLPIFLAK